MINAIRDWLDANRQMLLQKNIRCSLSDDTRGTAKDSIYMELTSDEFEAAVELWETGESEFYLINLRSGNVEVSHYEFEQREQLYGTLEGLISQLQHKAQ